MTIGIKKRLERCPPLLIAPSCTLLFAPAKYSNYNARLIAAVAQLVEQRIRNAKVASSIPASGTSKIKRLAQTTSLGFLLSGFRVGTSSVSRPIL